MLCIRPHNLATELAVVLPFADTVPENQQQAPQMFLRPFIIDLV